MANEFKALERVRFRPLRPLDILADRPGAAHGIWPLKGGAMSLVDMALRIGVQDGINRGVEFEPVAVPNPFTGSAWVPGGSHVAGYADLAFVCTALRMAAGGGAMVNCIGVAWRWNGGGSSSFSVGGISRSFTLGSPPSSGVAFIDDATWDAVPGVLFPSVSGDSYLSVVLLGVPFGGLVSTTVPPGWSPVDHYPMARMQPLGRWAEAPCPADGHPIPDVGGRLSIGVTSGCQGLSLGLVHDNFHRLHTWEYTRAPTAASLITTSYRISHREHQRYIDDDGDRHVFLASPPDQFNGWIGDSGGFYPSSPSSGIDAYITSSTSSTALDSVAVMDAGHVGRFCKKTTAARLYCAAAGTGTHYLRICDLASGVIVHDSIVSLSSGGWFDVALSDPGTDESEPMRLCAQIHTYKTSGPSSPLVYLWPHPQFHPPLYPVPYADGSGMVSGAVKSNWLRAETAHSAVLSASAADASTPVAIAIPSRGGEDANFIASAKWLSPAPGWYTLSVSGSYSSAVVVGASAMAGAGHSTSHARMTRGLPLAALFLSPGTASVVATPVVFTPSPQSMSLGSDVSVTTAAGYGWLSFTAPADGSYKISGRDDDAVTSVFTELFIGSDPSFLTWDGEPAGRSDTANQAGFGPHGGSSPAPNSYAFYAVLTPASGSWVDHDHSLAIGGESSTPDPGAWVFYRPHAGDHTTNVPRWVHDGTEFVRNPPVSAVRKMVEGETVYIRMAARSHQRAPEGEPLIGGTFKARVDAV